MNHSRLTRRDKRRRAMFARLDEDPVRIKTKALGFYSHKQWNEALDCLDKLLDSGMMLDTPQEHGPDHQEVRLKFCNGQCVQTQCSKRMVWMVKKCKANPRVP